MAKKGGGKSKGGRSSTATKTQVLQAWCGSCHQETPILHVQILSLKKRWVWKCTTCGGEVSR